MGEAHEKPEQRVAGCTLELETVCRALIMNMGEKHLAKQALCSQMALTAAEITAIPYPVFCKDANTRLISLRAGFRRLRGLEQWRD